MVNQNALSEEQFAQLRAALKSQGSMSIHLLSESMAPVLKTGERAQVEFCEAEDLKPLDFIVFFHEGRLVCHTVWEQGFFPSANGVRTLITRGLANPFFDEPVKFSQVLGRVTSHRVSWLQFLWLSARAKAFARFRGWGALR